MRKEEDKKRKREEADYYFNASKRLAQDDEEAEKRYNKYVSRDPFPHIEAALLNSADIFKYVAKTGMICPFNWNRLEGASYPVAIKGLIIWWDESGRREQKLEKEGDIFELKPNSIAFITLEPMFRIPDYMALRFNLRIVHVYKGLLLGTGPLVDPGFVGKLSLPLHNLTDNTYIFRAGDEIIQMEFTKLSRNCAWNPAITTTGMYIRKRIDAKRTVEDYIKRSLGSREDAVLRSSIHVAIENTKKEADVAQKEAQSFRQRIRLELKEFKKETQDKLKQGNWLNIATIIGIVSVMAFACTAIYQLGTANSVKKELILEIEKEFEEYTKEVNIKEAVLIERIEELEKQLAEFSEVEGKPVNEP